MNKKLKLKMLRSVRPRNIKWLFGGSMPMPYLYIYEGLPDDFILWYEKEELQGKKWDDLTTGWGGLQDMSHVEFMTKLWLRRVKWISTFSNLVRKPFAKKSYITSCMVETKQDYSDFKTADILDVIKYFGTAAGFLYSARRDVFNSCPVLNPGKYEPLNKYYMMSLEYITWLVATFMQDGSFTDFYTLLDQKLHPLSASNPLLLPKVPECPGQTIRNCLKAGTDCRSCIRNPYHSQTDRYLPPEDGEISA